MLLALTLFGANLLPGQGTPQKSALGQLSGSIRELTDRVSPAVVEVIANGYSRKHPREGTRLGLPWVSILSKKSTKAVGSYPVLYMYRRPNWSASASNPRENFKKTIGTIALAAL